MLLLGVKNVGTQDLEVNGLINFGSVYRKYCKKNSCGIRTFDLSGTSISLNQEGMYRITITTTFTAPAVGDVTLQLLEDGVAVSGAVVTDTISTATSDIRTVTLDYIVLVDSSYILGRNTTVSKNISLQNTGVASTISNIVTNIVKVV